MSTEPRTETAWRDTAVQPRGAQLPYPARPLDVQPGKIAAPCGKRKHLVRTLRAYSTVHVHVQEHIRTVAAAHLSKNGPLKDRNPWHPTSEGSGPGRGSNEDSR